MKNYLITPIGITLTALSSATAQKLVPPQSFVINCQVCHALEDAAVGPSLIEISKLYPNKKKKEFIQWCIDPGKKRPEMAQMPSMAHISKDELTKIHKHILEITKGKDLRVRVKEDLFKESPTATARPRVTRTLLPDTGPASLIVALPSKEDHNVVWDTDQCRVRYISAGKIDNFPYLKSNGNAVAKVGKVLYTEDVLFTGDLPRQFKGYSVSENGYPTFMYTVGDILISEEILLKDESIVRVFKAEVSLPPYEISEDENKEIATTSSASGNTLTITHRPL